MNGRAEQLKNHFNNESVLLAWSSFPVSAAKTNTLFASTKLASILPSFGSQESLAQGS